MKTIIASILMLAAIPAGAGTTIPELSNTQPVATTGSGWQFRAALYGWATALDGDVTLRGKNAPVDCGFGDVLDNLDFAVMGAVEIRHGKWGLLADLFYAELGTGNSIGNLDYEAGLKQFISNFIVTRNLVETANTHVDVYAGARVNWLNADLDITSTGIVRTRTFSGSQSKTWGDPIIGARLQQELPACFFLRAVGDIGGFGVSSDLTWQAMAGLGYHINDASSMFLGYRGIGTDYKDGSFGYDVISHGLLLGFECKF